MLAPGTHYPQFNRHFPDNLQIQIKVLRGQVLTPFPSMRPVCVPIGDHSLRRFDPPIEERQDRDFTMKIFQQREGQNGVVKWHPCKTWVSRFFFF